MFCGVHLLIGVNSGIICNRVGGPQCLISTFREYRTQFPMFLSVIFTFTVTFALIHSLFGVGGYKWAD